MIPVTALSLKRSVKLLDELLLYHTNAFAHLNQLDILVVGAGDFPSFMSLYDLLMLQWPHLKMIRFVIVEPTVACTKIFEERHQQLFREKAHHLSYLIANTTIHSFLKLNPNLKFDIIYFEHPEISPLTPLMSILLPRKYKNELDLICAFPHLSFASKDVTIILASFILSSNLKMFKRLFNFCFEHETRIIKRSPYFINDGKVYSAGFISSLHPASIKHQPGKLLRLIRFHNVLHFILVMASGVLLMLTTGPVVILSGLLFLIQVVAISYRRFIFLIKILIVFIQALMMAYT